MFVVFFFIFIWNVIYLDFCINVENENKLHNNCVVFFILYRVNNHYYICLTIILIDYIASLSHTLHYKYSTLFLHNSSHTMIFFFLIIYESNWVKFPICKYIYEWNIHNVNLSLIDEFCLFFSMWIGQGEINK